VWRTNAIQRTLAYATSPEYVEDLEGNPYGYPYNVSGIEMAYVLETFDLGDESDRHRWLERQFSRTYDAESNRMTRNNPDPTTLTARLYEATRVSDVEISTDFETGTRYETRDDGRPQHSVRSGQWSRSPMTETDHPLVSVIIPVYNDPDGIRRCFEALRKQSYPTERFEILAVDNGSTDDTRAVIQDALAGVPNGYLLVEDEIQGSYAARNAGIERATGEVLAFTDADCTPAPTWIESGVKTLRARTQIWPVVESSSNSRPRRRQRSDSTRR